MWYEKKKMKDGTIRYAFLERYVDSYTGDIKRVSVRLNSCSKQAHKQASIILADKIKSLTAEKETQLSFTSISDEWLSYIAPSLKPSTMREYELVLRRIINRLPVNILINKITIAMVQSLLNTVYIIENLSYAYTKHHFIIIRSVFRYAKRMRYIKDISFLEDVEIRKKPSTLEDITKTRNKFLDQDELIDVLHQLSKINNRIMLAMEFISRTGLRFGELVALRKCDYDDTLHVIDVNGSIVSFKKNDDETQRGTPKNNHSFRKVLLDDRCVDILNTLFLENKKMQLWFKGYNDRGYIFTSERGNPLNLQYVNRILRKVHIPNKKISTHIFRHTHISLLAELNLPLKSIMERVGHNDPRTTLSVYTHVSESAKQEVIVRLNKVKIN